jgi:hypothetical protein
MFLSNWCEDEEGDCTKLANEITVKVYAQILDKTVWGACDESYAVDFWKVHCGGGPSNTMSYIFKGCYAHESKEDWYYVQKEGIGTWDITFKYEEDNLHVKLVDYKGEEVEDIGMYPVIDGKSIYSLTNGGSKGLGIMVTLTTDPEFSLYSTITFQ